MDKKRLPVVSKQPLPQLSKDQFIQNRNHSSYYELHRHKRLDFIYQTSWITTATVRYCQLAVATSTILMDTGVHQSANTVDLETLIKKNRIRLYRKKKSRSII